MTTAGAGAPGQGTSRQDGGGRGRSDGSGQEGVGRETDDQQPGHNATKQGSGK
ncbi:MAG: hypothetical protein ABJD68_04145 [Nakamurella sp.]